MLGSIASKGSLIGRTTTRAQADTRPHHRRALEILHPAVVGNSLGGCSIPLHDGSVLGRPPLLLLHLGAQLPVRRPDSGERKLFQDAAAHQAKLSALLGRCCKEFVQEAGCCKRHRPCFGLACHCQRGGPGFGGFGLVPLRSGCTHGWITLDSIETSPFRHKGPLLVAGSSPAGCCSVAGKCLTVWRWGCTPTAKHSKLITSSAGAKRRHRHETSRGGPMQLGCAARCDVPVWRGGLVDTAAGLEHSFVRLLTSSGC